MVELLHRGPVPSASNAFRRKDDAPPTHSHAESDVTSLVSDLAGKSPTSHSHTGLTWSDRVVILTDATSITPNAQSGLVAAFRWNMAAASTLIAPTNPGELQIIRVAVKPASALNLILSGFIGSSDYATGTIALASGKWTTFVFQYIGDIGWQWTGKSVSA